MRSWNNFRLNSLAYYFIFHFNGKLFVLPFMLILQKYFVPLNKDIQEISS